MKNSILITVDVEDWFQVENFKSYIPFSAWPKYALRVEQNTHQLLEILERRRATFFVLGWLAERLPHLLREIHNQGHEIGSHGYNHKLCTQMSAAELKADLVDSKKRLEDIIGGPVHGYRAPSFSIDADILKRIRDCGYQYDSSYNSFALHGRYGKLDLSGACREGVAVKMNPDFYEIPISNLYWQKQVLPWGGGGYFRMIPFPLFRLGIQRILAKEGAYVFYMHPWEIDSEQPRVEQAKKKFKLRHYTNLNRAHLKLTALLNHFSNCRFLSCHRYLTEKSSERQMPAVSSKYQVSPYLELP